MPTFSTEGRALSFGRHRFSVREQLEAERFYQDLLGLRPRPRPRSARRRGGPEDASELLPSMVPHPGHALLPDMMRRLQAERARKLARYKELFIFHKLATDTDTIDEAAVERLLRQFQTSKRLPSTGEPTAQTLWALQQPWARARKLTIAKVTADKLPNVPGGNSFMLRSDVVAPYEALRRDVLAAGGVITSAGGIRDLSEAATEGRSVTSLHYTGVAFDLSTASGMQNPTNDRYIVTRDGGVTWRVWCKSDTGQERSLSAVKWVGGRTETVAVTARVIDFTTMALRHGFHRIAQRDNFPDKYLAAEWWHFQCEAVLVPGVSQFGTELLSISHYTETVLSGHPNLWVNRGRIFKKDWG